jgi:hypothetical protein
MSLEDVGEALCRLDGAVRDLTGGNMVAAVPGAR